MTIYTIYQNKDEKYLGSGRIYSDFFFHTFISFFLSIFDYHKRAMNFIFAGRSKSYLI